MPKNVLLTSWYTGLGGGETDLLSLARGLNPAEYRPHLLVPGDGALANQWRQLGFPVHIIPYRGATIYFIPKVWAQFPVVQRFADLLRQEAIDLVHAEYHTLPLILPACKQAGIPLLWTVHGWWFKPKFWQKGFFRPLQTIARSYSIREGFLGKPSFMPIERVPVIYSGVDTERFHPAVDGTIIRQHAQIPDGAPIIALVARFQHVKGHHIFQAMALEVLKTIPDAHFIIAGEDTFGVSADLAYKEAILKQAQDNPLLRDHLHYIGFRDDVERVLACADVVVCASLFESYGKVNLEAMACGKPVVSSNRGGPSETVQDGVTGFLVPPEASEQMAQRVVQLLGDASLRMQMGRAGRQRVEAIFAEKTATRAYEGQFESALSQTKE